MSTTIESLELEIKSNSRSAAKGIDALTQSLTKLRSATKNSGLGGVAKETDKVSKSLKKVSETSSKTTSSFSNLFYKGKVLINTFKKVTSTLWSCIEKSADYTENMNLFSVAMGQYGNEAKAYADKVSDALGIDTSDWVRSQGIFMTLATGFGVAGDRASTMSKNLTQLGYDLASFYNLDVEDAMQKLQSGLSGELEPLRRIGYDLSQARLEAIALELGINKSVSSMTQAEKAQLRYYAIMTQVTTAQGDMARTINDPANQMRVLKAQIEMTARAIGNVFIPALQSILPYAISIVKVVGDLANSLATIVGYEAPDIGESALVDSTAAVTENLEESQEEAKKLKSYMLGIDELNVINPNATTEGSALGGLDFELPEYDFLAGLTGNKVDGIVENIKNVFSELKEIVDSIDFSPLVENARELFDTIKSQFKELDFGTPLKDIFGGLLSAINEFANIVLEVINPIVDAINIPRILAEVLGVLGSAFSAISSIISSLTPIVSGLMEAFSPIIEWISGTVSDALTFLGEEFTEIGDLFTSLKPTFDNVGKSLGKIVSALWNLIEPLLSTVWEGTMNFLNKLSEVLDPIIEEIENLANVTTKDLSDAFTKFGEILKPLVDFVQTVMSDVFGNILSSILEDLSQNILPVLTETFVNLWNNVLVPLTDFIGATLTPVFQIVSDLLTYLWTNIILPLSNALTDNFGEAFKGIGDVLNDTVIPILKVLIDTCQFWWDKVLSPLIDRLWNNFKPIFESVFGDIGKIIDDVSQIFSGLIEFVTGVFTGDWERAWNGVKGVFIGIWNGILGCVESVINWIIRGINGLLSGAGSIVGWVGDILGYNMGNIDLIPEVHFNRVEVPAYAAGGFPEQGQIFIANEAGAEMVGNIGRRTAVANNDQIVASISGGVAEANEEQNALLREQNSLLRAILEKDSGVYLDGKNLTNSVEKYQRERGRILITGGVL